MRVSAVVVAAAYLFARLWYVFSSRFTYNSIYGYLQGSVLIGVYLVPVLFYLPHELVMICSVHYCSYVPRRTYM